MLFASVVESGASVETVVSDDTGLGRLEALSLRFSPFVPTSPQASEPVSDPTFFLLAF